MRGDPASREAAKACCRGVDDRGRRPAGRYRRVARLDPRLDPPATVAAHRSYRLDGHRHRWRPARLEQERAAAPYAGCASVEGSGSAHRAARLGHDDRHRGAPTRRAGWGVAPAHDSPRRRPARRSTRHAWTEHRVRVDRRGPLPRRGGVDTRRKPTTAPACTSGPQPSTFGSFRIGSSRYLTGPAGSTPAGVRSAFSRGVWLLFNEVGRPSGNLRAWSSRAGRRSSSAKHLPCRACSGLPPLPPKAVLAAAVAGGTARGGRPLTGCLLFCDESCVSCGIPAPHRPCRPRGPSPSACVSCPGHRLGVGSDHRTGVGLWRGTRCGWGTWSTPRGGCTRRVRTCCRRCTRWPRS